MNSATTNIIDASVPDIQVPTLVPKYTAAPNPWNRVFKRVLKDLGNQVRSKINSFSDWLISHIPSQVKRPTNKKLQDLMTKVSERKLIDRPLQLGRIIQRLEDLLNSTPSMGFIELMLTLFSTSLDQR